MRVSTNAEFRGPQDPIGRRRRSRVFGAITLAMAAVVSIGLVLTPAAPAQALDIVQFVSVNGRFQNALGIDNNTPPCLTYVPTPQSTVPTDLNQVRFGTPAGVSGCGATTSRSGFGFEGVSTPGLYGSLFEFGRFSHYNNPIDSSNSKVGTVDLSTTFTFRDLRDNTTVTFNPVYKVTLDETPNGANPCAYPDGPNQNGCADKVTIQQPTPLNVTLGGTTFTIDVGGFGIVDQQTDLCNLNTIVTGNSILTPEGGTSEFCIYGTASKSKLVINKTAVGGNGSFTFRYEELSQMTATPQPISPPRVSTSTVTTSNGSGTSGVIDVEPGVYTLDEINLAAGVAKGTLTCTSSLGGSDAYITLAGTQYLDFDSGETITCSLTNTFNASITIVKDAIPNAAQDFSFTTTGGNGLPGSLQLDDDANATLPNSVTYSVPAGNYTITEGANPTNWSLQGLVCTLTNYPGDNATQSVNGATASLHVGPGDNATCTYTNRASARLRLSKQWLVGKSGDTATLTSDVTPPAGVDRTFTSTATGVNPQVDNDATFVTVPLGSSVGLAETVSPAANYTSSLVCTDDRTGASITSLTAAADGRSGTLVTNATESAIGATITCQFSNPRRQATVNVTKALSPTTDPGTFTLSASGQAGGPAAVTGGHGATTAATVNVGDSITVSEVGANGTNLSNYTSSLVCTGPAGFTAVNGSTTGTFTVPTAAADGVINCTFTNTRRSAQARVDKQWVNARVGEAVTISATGGTNNPGLASTAGTASETDAGTPVTVYAGQTLTFSEVFGVPANAVNYTTTLSCTGAADTNPNDGLVIAPNDTNVVCTYRNERKSATFTLQKSWTSAIAGDRVGLAASTTPTHGETIATTATAPAGAAGTNSITVYAGETVNFAEAFQIGDPANYDTTLNCTGATVAPGAGNRSGSYSVGSTPANVSCTFNNARKVSGVRVVKNWVGSRTGDQAVLTATLGALTDIDTVTAPNNSVINGDEALDTSVFIPAFAGDTVNFAESLGANAGLYNATWSCRGAAATAGGSGSVTLSAADAGTTVVCTITNTRRTATVNLTKALVPAADPGTFTLSITGQAGGPATTTGGNAATTSAVVAVGDSITVSEVGANGTNLGNYSSVLMCTGPTGFTTVNGTTTGTFTVPPAAGEGVVNCTITNTRRSAQVRVAKQWVSARNGESVTISSTGGTNNPSLSSTVAGADITHTGTPVTVYAGQTLTLSEVFGVPANAVNYTTTLSCTGAADTNPSDGLAIGPNDTNVVCTYRNERKSATFALQKSWLNATAGELVNLDADGSDPANGQIVDTTATAPAGAATGNSMTVYAGETVSFSESFQVAANAGNYDTTLNCTGAAVTPGAGNRSGSYSVGSTPGNVTCTFANARKLSGVRVVKNWVDGRQGDQALLTAAVGNITDTDTSVAPDASVVSADEDDDNTVFVPAFAGDTVTFSEDLGANASLYDSTWSCRGAAATSGTSGSVVVSPADTSAVVCTITNTRRTATVIVEKQTVPDGAAQAFGFDVNWSATDPSLTDGQSVTAQVLAGQQYTVTELATDGWSLTGIVCTPSTNSTVSVGNATATVTPAPGDSIRCVFTNAQRGAVSVDKTVTSPVTHTTGYDYTVAYQVQVTTQSNIPEPFVLTDVPSFGPGTTITSTAVTRTSAIGPAANVGWNGVTDNEIASGSINPGDAITYEVTIGFRVSPTITSDARDCDTTTGLTATGSMNTATVEYGDDDTDSSFDCDEIPNPEVTVTKSIPQGSELVRNADGTWTVGYLLTVTNGGDGPGQYELEDELTLPTGVTVVAIAAAVIDAPITTADLDPDFDGVTNTLLAAGVPIEAADQHTYRVALTVSIVIDDTTTGDCSGQGGGGLLNTITVTVDGVPIDDSACAAFSILTLDKQLAISHGAEAVEADFNLTADGPTSIAGDGLVTAAVLPGTYALDEAGPDGFDTLGYVCDNTVTPTVGWSAAVVAGERVTCVITNSDRPVDLQLTKSDGGAVAAAGGSPFDYTITISNVGTRHPDLDEPVTVTDLLPTGLAWVSFPATCSQAGQTLTCSIDPALLGVGDPAVVLVASVRALPDAPSGMYVNKAFVTTEDDPACVGASCTPPCPTQQVANNNVDCEETPLVRNGAVQIVKTDDVADGDTVEPGETFSYSLAVTNTGPATLLPGLVVTDDLPADLTLVSAVGGAGWTCNAADPIECTYAPALAAGASAPTITVTVKVVPAATTSPIHNVAVVTAAVDRDCPVDMPLIEAFDPACNQVTDSDDEDTPMTPFADLAIVKTSSIDVVGAGGGFDWVLNVVNNGPGVARDVEIGDIVPSTVTVVGVSSSQFSCGFVGNTVTCTKPSMAVGEAGQILISVEVPTGAVSAPIVNVGTVEGSTPDPNLTNNSDDDDVTVVAQAPPTIAPPVTNPLPKTGNDAGGMVRAGVLLLAVGALMVLATRRRTSGARHQASA